MLTLAPESKILLVKDLFNSFVSVESGDSLSCFFDWYIVVFDGCCGVAYFLQSFSSSRALPGHVTGLPALKAFASFLVFFNLSRC